jgi:hypothetical protein
LYWGSLTKGERKKKIAGVGERKKKNRCPKGVVVCEVECDGVWWCGCVWRGGGVCVGGGGSRQEMTVIVVVIVVVIVLLYSINVVCIYVEEEVGCGVDWSGRGGCVRGFHSYVNRKICVIVPELFPKIIEQGEGVINSAVFRQQVILGEGGKNSSLKMLF